MLTQQQPANVVDLVSLDLDLQAVPGPRGRGDRGASLASLLQDGSHCAWVQTIGLQIPDHGHLGGQSLMVGADRVPSLPKAFQSLSSLITPCSSSLRAWCPFIQITYFCASKSILSSPANICVVQGPARISPYFILKS